MATGEVAKDKRVFVLGARFTKEFVLDAPQMTDDFGAECKGIHSTPEHTWAQLDSNASISFPPSRTDLVPRAV